MSKISGVSDDILDNIMSRLPAKPFAVAACVSRLWNRVSDSILSRPRLASGLSLAVSPEVRKINIICSIFIINASLFVYKYIM